MGVAVKAIRRVHTNVKNLLKTISIKKPQDTLDTSVHRVDKLLINQKGTLLADEGWLIFG